MSLDWKGDETLEALIKAVDKAVKECAMDLKRKAVSQTPIDTGALRKSAYVYKPKELEREVGYDRNNAKGILKTYAIVQHERLDFNHPKGGNAKFLESPFNKNKSHYIQLIAEKVKEVLR